VILFLDRVFRVEWAILNIFKTLQIHAKIDDFFGVKLWLTVCMYSIVRDCKAIFYQSISTFLL